MTRLTLVYSGCAATEMYSEWFRRVCIRGLQSTALQVYCDGRFHYIFSGKDDETAGLRRSRGLSRLLISVLRAVTSCISESESYRRSQVSAQYLSCAVL